MSDVKVCGRCQQSKPVAEFPVCRRNKDGLFHQCKPCKVEAMRDVKVRQGWQRQRRSKAHCPDHKVCSGCQRDLPLEEFHRCRGRLDGRAATCRGCSSRAGIARRPNSKRKPRLPDEITRKTNRRKATAAWRAKNIEHLREYERQRAERDPEGIRSKNKAYFVRRDAAEGSHTPKEWQAKCAEYSFRCAYCQKTRRLTRHHVVPLVKGGSDWISNIVPACRSCNSRIGTKTVLPGGMDAISLSAAWVSGTG